MARPGEPRRGRVTDEERGDDQVQLVHQAAGQELGAEPGAALHHEPADAPPGQVGQHAQSSRSGSPVGTTSARPSQPAPAAPLRPGPAP